MTEPKDKKKDAPEDDFFIEMEELPPMDHDETLESDPIEMASFLEPMDEGETGELTQEQRQVSDFDPMEISRDLIDDSKGVSFLEDQEDHPPIEANVCIEDEALGWTEDGNVHLDTIGNDWFIEEEKQQNVLGDDGGEGPTEDREDTFGIDEDAWDNLDNEELDDSAEEPLDAMERLGIGLPYNEDEESAECSLVLERQFLGPDNGDVKAVVFQGGSPLAAGEGLFVLGADGMLHSTWSENTPSINANSLYVRGESIFMGTADMGALVTHDRGQHFKQLNSWFTQGLLRGVQASSDQVSTSFKIYGQEAPFGYRLLGLTGRGQLFSSVDGGKTWRNLAIPGQCLSLCAVSGTSELFMVTQSKDGEVELWWSATTDAWDHRQLPDFWQNRLESPYSISIEATSKALIIGSDSPLGPAAFTLDGCKKWSRIEGAGVATALALDKDDPMCMAASTYESAGELATVVYSDDSGKSWQTVLTIKPNAEEGETPGSETGCPVVDLAVHTGRTREIVAVTKKGVYLVTLTRKGVSH